MTSKCTLTRSDGLVLEVLGKKILINFQQSAKEHIRSPNVSFDTIDYSDAESLRLAQDSMLREQFIRIAAVKLCRRALENCYVTSGPNHFEDCREIRERYLKMLPQSTIEGYLGYQKNDPTK